MLLIFKDLNIRQLNLGTILLKIRDMFLHRAVGLSVEKVEGFRSVLRIGNYFLLVFGPRSDLPGHHGSGSDFQVIISGSFLAPIIQTFGVQNCMFLNAFFFLRGRICYDNFGS